MKKLIFLIVIFSCSSILTAYSFEVKGGIDFGSKSDKTDGLDIDLGYNGNLEILFGKRIEYGIGAGYYNFGDINSDNSKYDNEKYLNNSAFYGVARYNFKIKKLNSYLKAGLGATVFGVKKDYFDIWEKSLEDGYISKGYDTAQLEFQLKPQLYWAVGYGMEYRKVMVEVMYESLKLGVDATGEITQGTYKETLNITASDIVINTITLKLGYKFGK